MRAPRSFAKVSRLFPFVLGALFACTTPPGGGTLDGGDAGLVDGATPDGTVTVDCDASRFTLSEGSPDSPVLLSLESAPWSGYVSYDGGPSHYQVTGLTVGARYEFYIDAAVAGYVRLYQSHDLSKPICAKSSFHNTKCYFVPQGPTVNIEFETNSYGQRGGCYQLDITLHSAPERFEGAPDAPREVRFGTEDLPHLGFVDEYLSFYRLSGLVPGRRYTVWVTGVQPGIGLLVGDEDPIVGFDDNPCAYSFSNYTAGSRPETKDLYCNFEATANAHAIAVGFQWDDGPAHSRFILSAFEDFPPDGTPDQPMELVMGTGGIRHMGSSGGTISHDGVSYYHITGLTEGKRYMFSSDASNRAYTDESFATMRSCLNYDYYIFCEVEASSTDIYVDARVLAPITKFFVLRVDEMPENQGTIEDPIVVQYPADFPFRGQAASRSHYRIVGAPTSPVRLALGDVNGLTNSHIVSNDGGEILAWVDGPSHFELNLELVGAMTSTFTNTEVLTLPKDVSTGVLSSIHVDDVDVESIREIQVEIYLDFPFDTRNFEIDLTAPDGTTLSLVQIPSGLVLETRLPGFGFANFQGLIFSDYVLEREEGYLTRRTRYARPNDALHGLLGHAANGQWSIRVVDGTGVAQPTVKLHGWGLNFE
jgi:subtilisin-like proprotein convertase family protein